MSFPVSLYGRYMCNLQSLVPFHIAEGMAITACAIVGIGVSLLFWVGLSRYRKSRALRLGQPRLCVMIIVSTLGERHKISRSKMNGWMSRVQRLQNMPMAKIV